MWLRYLASLIKGRTEAEVVREKAIENIIWTKREEGTKRRMKVRNKEYHDLYPCFSHYIIKAIRSKEWDGRDVLHA